MTELIFQIHHSDSQALLPFKATSHSHTYVKTCKYSMGWAFNFSINGSWSLSHSFQSCSPQTHGCQARPILPPRILHLVPHLSISPEPGLEPQSSPLTQSNLSLPHLLFTPMHNTGHRQGGFPVALALLGSLPCFSSAESSILALGCLVHVGWGRDRLKWPAEWLDFMT